MRTKHVFLLINNNSVLFSLLGQELYLIFGIIIR